MARFDEGACNPDGGGQESGQVPQGRRAGGAPGHGRRPSQLRSRGQACRGARPRRRRRVEARRDEGARDREPLPAGLAGAQAPRGRAGGAEAQAQGKAARVGPLGEARGPRAGARRGEPRAQGGGGPPEEIEGPGSGKAGTRDERRAVRVLSGGGRAPAGPLAAPGAPASTHRCSKAGGPKAPTRPGLREGAAGTFSRAANGRGRRQAAMRPRAEKGASVAGRTALETMRETGASCGVRRETGCRERNSCKGAVGGASGNAPGRDFPADARGRSSARTSPSPSGDGARPAPRPPTTSAARGSSPGRYRSVPTWCSRRRCPRRRRPRRRKGPTPSCGQTRDGGISAKHAAARRGTLG